MIGLRIPDSCMVYRVETELVGIVVGDKVLVQLQDGEVVGLVLHLFTQPVEPYPGLIRKVIRRLHEKDHKFLAWRAVQEPVAHRLCREKIREMKLAMKLSKVTYPFGGSRAIVHFTSDARVDFRELVRVLSAELKVRVEMRHVGVRDESKILCGLGSCGKTLCCSEFLTKFHPVSVRMAKNQDLSLTPEGISGVCGRLMCCLAYENDAYLALRKGMPKAKARVTLKDGREGVVREVYPLLNRVELQMADGVIEKCDVDKLVGDFCAQCGDVGGELENKPVVPETPLVVEKPLPPERTGRRSDPERGQRGTPAPRKGPALSLEKEAEKIVAAAVPVVEVQEAADGVVKKRTSARRKRRGGAKPALATNVPSETPALPEVAVAPQPEGTAPRPPGTARRRRRRSVQRRSGGGESVAPTGGETES
ncbi:MAG: hypothetical protein HQL94_09025 [Magnetococcales bacterium]|nr:hypothetical protein [Magnetococcales bacterium]